MKIQATRALIYIEITLLNGPSRPPSALLCLITTETLPAAPTLPCLSNSFGRKRWSDVHVFGVNSVGGKVQYFAFGHKGNERGEVLRPRENFEVGTSPQEIFMSAIQTSRIIWEDVRMVC